MDKKTGHVRLGFKCLRCDKQFGPEKRRVTIVGHAVCWTCAFPFKTRKVEEVG